VKKLFLYIKYYFELNDRQLCAEAYQAAKDYYLTRPLRNSKNLHPSVVSYQQRIEESLAFQRAYKDKKRHNHAIQKLNQITA
jgi:hypothetical protein